MASVSLVMRALIRYPAAPIDHIASRALARKTRLVTDPSTRTRKV